MIVTPPTDEHCDICLERGLYPLGYEFERLLVEDRSHIGLMAYSSYGLAMLWYDIDCNDKLVSYIGCYVKKPYRRQGFGTELLNALGGVGDHYWSPNSPGSDEFFLRNTE